MSNASVKTVFEKDTCRMVWGAIVLLRGVRIGILYNLLGNIISDGCNNSIVIESGEKVGKNHTISREKTMFWHQILGHIKKKGLWLLHSNGMV